jgi:phosphate transport system substrate-binding protein
MFIYVNTDALEQEEVVEFVNFYLDNATQLVLEVGYVPLPESQYNDGRAILNTAVSAAQSGTGQ